MKQKLGTDYWWTILSFLVIWCRVTSNFAEWSIVSSKSLIIDYSWCNVDNAVCVQRLWIIEFSLLFMIVSLKLELLLLLCDKRTRIPTAWYGVKLKNLTSKYDCIRALLFLWIYLDKFYFVCVLKWICRCTIKNSAQFHLMQRPQNVNSFQLLAADANEITPIV